MDPPERSFSHGPILTNFSRVIQIFKLQASRFDLPNLESPSEQNSATSNPAALPILRFAAVCRRPLSLSVHFTLASFPNPIPFALDREPSGGPPIKTNNKHTQLPLRHSGNGICVPLPIPIQFFLKARDNCVVWHDIEPDFSPLNPHGISHATQLYFQFDDVFPTLSSAHSSAR